MMKKMHHMRHPRKGEDNLAALRKGEKGADNEGEKREGGKKRKELWRPQGGSPMKKCVLPRLKREKMKGRGNKPLGQAGCKKRASISRSEKKDYL